MPIVAAIWRLLWRPLRNDPLMKSPLPCCVNAVTRVMFCTQNPAAGWSSRSRLWSPCWLFWTGDCSPLSWSRATRKFTWRVIGCAFNRVSERWRFRMDQPRDFLLETIPMDNAGLPCRATASVRRLLSGHPDHYQPLLDAGLTSIKRKPGRQVKLIPGVLGRRRRGRQHHPARVPQRGASHRHDGKRIPASLRPPLPATTSQGRRRRNPGGNSSPDLGDSRRPHRRGDLLHRFPHRRHD